MAIKIQNSTIIDDSRNIVNAGITTVTSVSIGNTQVISSARQLQNIASLDATTTATIEAAITNAPNTFTDLQVAGVSTFTNGPVLVGSATSTGTVSQRLQVTGGAYVSGNTGIGTTSPTSRLTVSGDVLVSGVITATSFSGNSLTATYTTTAGVATYAGIAGIATYAVTAGVSTYAGVAGVSTFSGYSNTSGFSTFSGYSNTSGFSTFSGYANNSGIATYAVTAGVATYAGVAGVSTSVIGGIASVTQLNVTGVSTLTAISAGGTTGINQYVLTSTGTGLSWQSVTGIGAITGINIAPDSTNTASYIPFVKISTGTTATQYADTSLVYNSGTQRLGIGTTNPTSKLDVVGDAKFTGVVTATTFSGNATSATQLQTARNFSITGGFVTASAISFDGTGNVALAATITADSIGLGTYTSGDYVKNIFGTANQITVTSGTGEGSTPTLSIPNQFTAPQDITVTRDLQVNRNLNVNGSITIGGTSATLFTTELKISDPDIVLGFRTDANGNDISNDNTSNHGGVALASTEGTPLVQLFIAGIETNPATYKKIMWFKAGTFAGLGTDAWLSNYAVGIGSTQFPVGTRLAAGSVQFTENDLAVVRNINASGIITATTFRGNATSATSATYAGIAGFSTFSGYSNTSGFSTFSGYANNAGIATYAVTAGVSTYAGIAGISTSVIGGIASVTQLQVSGITTVGFITATNIWNAGITTSSRITLNGANDTTTGGGQIYLNGATGNRIDFNTNGIAAPTFTTRSAGTKIVLFSNIGASSADYALGIESGTLWNSVPVSGNQFRWYGGQTQLADLKGSGEFLLGSTSIVSSAKLQVTGGAYVSGNLGVGNTNGEGIKLFVSQGAPATNRPVALITDDGTIPTMTGGATLRISNDGSSNSFAGLEVESGVGKLVFTNAGNLGIGTTNPTSALHVVGNTLVTGVSTFNNNINVASGIITTTGSGGVGIGSFLRLKPYLNEGGEIGFDYTNGGLGYYLDVSGGNVFRFSNYDTNGTYTFTTNSTEKVRISNAGNLGIGTNNPTVALQLSPNASISNVGSATTLAGTVGSALTVAQFYHSNTNASYIRIKAARNATGSDWTTASTKLVNVTDVTEQGYIEYNPSGSTYGMAFGSGATEWARFTSAGNFGIGVTNPSQKFEVSGTSRFFTSGQGDVTISHSSFVSTIRGASTVELALGANNSEAIRINTSRNVGIGTTNPTSALHVVGNTLVTGISTFTGAVSFGTSAYFGDNDIAYFGDGNDLQIYHDGSNSYIADYGTGRLVLTSNGAGVDIVKAPLEYTARFLTDGAVELYYDNTKEFETTGYGATVYGTLQSQGLNVSGISTIAGVQFTPTGIVTASTVSGIVTYYGDGSKLTGISAGAFNIINQPLTSTTVYPTFAANIGVASVGITSTQVAYIPSSNRLGIGTTNPNYTLEIVGNTRVSGLTSVTNLEIYGTVGAGNTVGNDGQYLKSTGVGVTWASFPTLRTTGITTATQGQTVFNFAYNVGFLDVYVNGVKLTNSEFTAVNGANVTLQSQAFSGDIVEFVSYNTVSTGSGSGGAGSISLDSLTDVVITNPQEGESLGFDGTYWINDYTFTTTTATSSQVPIHTLSSNDYRSVEYMIQVTNGTNYHLTKILVLHNGTTAYNTEYGTISTGPALATFDTDVLGGAIRLLATPYSSSTMTYKIKFTAIKA